MPHTSGMRSYFVDQGTRFINLNKLFNFAFSFGKKGAKEKAWQKEKRRIKRISPSADGEEGFAPSTAQAFEKA